MLKKKENKLEKDGEWIQKAMQEKISQHARKKRGNWGKRYVF